MRWTTGVLVLAVAGLSAKRYGNDVAQWVLRSDASVFTVALGEVILPALLAAVAGYLFPRAFWPWGIAVLSLHPVAVAVWTARANSDGAFGPSGIGASELLSLAMVTTMMLFVYVLASTAASALGAGLRSLWWWSRGESVGGRLGLTSSGGNTE